mmetsp:Transcript_15057/g.13214  ORF Transcript_15057/g.13214 Transcript_15057/m.13214 type:complete len:82 (-) Transcript_15057:5-250(-)
MCNCKPNQETMKITIKPQKSRRKILLMTKPEFEIPQQDSRNELSPASFTGSSLKGKKLNNDYNFSNFNKETMQEKKFNNSN